MDEPGKTSGEAKDLFVPDDKQQQYCISTICVDSDGTLYYKNDSGYLMAVASNSAYLEDVDITASTGKIRWDDDFKPSKGRYTLSIPSGTKEVTVKLTIPEGRTATVNGTAYTGSCKVALDQNGEGTITAVVYNGSQKRTYQFLLMGLGSNADLSRLVVSEKNNINDTASYVALNPEFSASTTEYHTEIYSGEKKFLNVYGAPAGSFASVKAIAGEGVRRIMSYTSAPGSGDASRFAVYFDDSYSFAEVTLEVTAGDGKTKKQYHVTLLRADTYPPVLTEGKVWRLDENQAQVSFVSNENGTYFYQAVPEGDKEPEFDLTGTGTQMIKGKNTFTLEDLHGAGKDIYIMAVDSQGNQTEKPMKLSLSGHQELKITFEVTPAQAKIEILDDADRQISVANGSAMVLIGNHYRVKVSCDGYDTQEMEFTASADTTTYKIELKSNRSSDCSLKELYVSSSDKYGRGILKLTPDFAPETTHYSASYEKERDYLNLWIHPADEKATVKVYALSGVLGSTVSREDESIATEQLNGHLCCKVYFEKQLFEAGVRICVTAEDGSMENYFVDLAIHDTTAPQIKRVTASRITEKKASVIFKASEKGTYYYSVTEKGGSTEISTSGKGTEAIAGTNIISLNDLTKGEKEIHIIMKDLAGNFSNKLTIEIPNSRLTNTNRNPGRPGGHQSSRYLRNRNGSVAQGSGQLRRMNRASGRGGTKPDASGKTDPKENLKEQEQKNASGKEDAGNGKENSGSTKGTNLSGEKMIKAVQETWNRMPAGMQIAVILALLGLLYLLFWSRAYWYNRKKTNWRRERARLQFKKERRMV